MRVFSVVCVFALLPAPAAAGEPVDYTRDVKPLLAKHCVSCHGPQKQRSGLRLDRAAGIRTGGNGGAVVVPGKSAQSRLLHAVTGTHDMKAMPPKGPRLSDKEIALLRAWVDAGAPAPAAEVVARSGDRTTTGAASATHWAFRPVKRPTEPRVKDERWVRNPIDRFILARLEKEGVRPSPEADRVTLLRRVYLDLLGLPPSPQEVEQFRADKRPDAYERLVDRLLASPHYGERWGRHWLDLARYADSNGYSIDAPRSIWKYRDWVIDALNKDMPFDRFVIEQLAGDLLPSATPGQRIATGFHRNTQINEEGGIDLEQFRVEAVVDRTNTTGTVFLGLTVGCCQCHDHKFDPLSQRDYYQLFAFFNSTDDANLELPPGPEQLRKRKQTLEQIAALEKRFRVLDTTTPEKVTKWEGSLTPELKATLPRKIQEIIEIAANGRSARQQALVDGAYRKTDQVRHVLGGLGPNNPLNFLPALHLHALGTRLLLEKKIAGLKKRVPAITTTLVLRERKAPRATHVLMGGDFLRQGAPVNPDVPAVLPPLPTTGGRPTRLDLARWLVGRKNPLTARVAVNRYWQRYFGTGLVETENDFGTQGTPPSHPELLDYLAAEFMEGGWGMKAMHRLIVTSATYRQSSRARPDLATLDPRNRLLARQDRLRLDAEVVRDVALASTGLLCRTVGGPSVFPPQPGGVYAFTQVPRTWRADEGPNRYRRGLYTWFWRSAPHPGLIVFDAPDATATCTRRNRSNTPLQALTLLNDQAYYEFARALAARILAESRAGDEERLDYAFRLCLARQPSARERQALTRVLRQQRESFAAAPGEARRLVPAGLPRSQAEPGSETDVAQFAAWTMVGRVLLNLDEFITRE